METPVQSSCSFHTTALATGGINTEIEFSALALKNLFPFLGDSTYPFDRGELTNRQKEDEQSRVFVISHLVENELSLPTREGSLSRVHSGIKLQCFCSHRVMLRNGALGLR